MDKTIWKYVLDNRPCRLTLFLPRGAEILHVANQNGQIFAWALVDPKQDLLFREIEIVGTGNSLDTHSSRKYIGTVHLDPFVWHVFERYEQSVTI
jgi:hypothetical protein